MILPQPERESPLALAGRLTVEVGKGGRRAELRWGGGETGVGRGMEGAVMVCPKWILSPLMAASLPPFSF